MKYTGLQTQIWRNNIKSTLLLLAFPGLIFVLLWAFFFFSGSGEPMSSEFLASVPFVGGGVLLWFTIAYFSHNSMIEKATSSHSLSRKENITIYNLVENLCISQGMRMPKLRIIEDDSLNAFASGINEKTYTVTLSRGIINKLDTKELEGVIAHELTHIQNRDVRLLIVSIIFVGIFAFLAEMAFRMLVSGSRGEKKDARVMAIGFGLTMLGYLLSVLFRFALSRKREFLADAGAAKMTKNPHALASALRKISQDPQIEAVKRKDVAQLFIENPQEEKKNFFSSITALFATHPPIKERIDVLEQF